MAHTLLGSVSIMSEAARRLADDWDVDDRQLLLRMLTEHTSHVRNVLHALVRGLPQDACHSGESHIYGEKARA